MWATTKNLSITPSKKIRISKIHVFLMLVNKEVISLKLKRIIFNIATKKRSKSDNSTDDTIL
jgi:hypothetical protein